MNRNLKLSISMIFILIYSIVLAQQKDQDIAIQKLKNKTISSKGPERLIWLDSLATYLVTKTDEESDSILQEVINYAISLKNYETALKQTTNLIKSLNYQKGDLEKAKLIIEGPHQWIKWVKNSDILSNYYNEVGEVYYYLNQFEKALSSFESSSAEGIKTGSINVGFANLGKGKIYTDKGDFGKASIALQKGIRFFQERKDTNNIIDGKNSLAILYSKNNFFEEAGLERAELIDLSIKKNNINGLPIYYYNAAADANKANKQQIRIDLLRQACESIKKSAYQASYEPIMIYGLISAYAENDSLDLAKKYINEVEKNPSNQTGFFEAFYLDAKKRLVLAQKNYDDAIFYGQKYLDLKKQGDQYEEIQEAENFLSKAYEAIGRNDLAYLHFKNYAFIKDSIGNATKGRVLAYYQTLYETEKRDLKIKTQESNIALLHSQNKIKNQYLLFGGIGLLGLFGFFITLRSRNFAKNKQKLQEKFTQDMISAQEAERSRIAFELHDSVGQQLMLLSKKSKSLEDISFETLATETLENVRTISQDLHPILLERLGLKTGIEELVNNFDQNSELFFTHGIDDVDDQLNKEKTRHIYRICQELLSNIVKHSNAKSVEITLKNLKDRMLLSVEDNGKGFDFQDMVNNSKSLGMKSLIERTKIIGATMKVNSAHGKGTEIEINIPI